MHRQSFLGGGVVAVTLALGAPGLAAQGAPLRYDLRHDGSVRLEVTGQVRVRGEYWDQFAFGAVGTADTSGGFALSRLLAAAKLTLGEHVTLFLQGKSSLVTDRTLPGGQRTSDEDQIDLQQGYVEGRTRIGGYTAALRVGRTDLLLGRERLVSPLDWTNTRRTFQGGTLALSGALGTLTAMVVQPVQVRRTKPNIGDSLRVLAGLHAAHPVGQGRLGVDAYWFYSQVDQAAWNGTSGKEERHTIGGRLSTRSAPATGGFDADAEAAYQFGSVGSGDVAAYMVGAQVGYTTPRLPLGPRLYVGFDYGSGDDEPGGDVETFNHLFPLAHAFLGYADVHGRQNVMDVSLGGSGKAGAFTLMVDVHNFWLASGDDYLYGADGAAVASRDPLSTEAMMIGTEVDLTVRRPFLANRLVVQGGYSRYFTDEFLAATGPSHGLHWGYLQATWSF